MLALVSVALLILANGVFVGAEFALVTVSGPAMQRRADEGDRTAALVVRQLAELSFVLSAAQFGITATSLLVGFLAEEAVSDVVVEPLFALVGLQTSAGVSLVVAFGLSIIVQMVIGELAPKGYAIARPEPTARLLARPMQAFIVAFGPIIRVFDSAALALTRLVGMGGEGHGGAGLSRTELRRIVTASGESGSLSTTQVELLGRGLDLGETRLSEVMVPRPDVIALDEDATVDDLIEMSRTSGHSRFVVKRGDLDDVVGTVHIKDLLALEPADRARMRVGELSQPALIVPESEPLRRLLRRMRVARRTFVVAVDEYGGVAGIATVEDAVERLVGGIEDEFDAALPQVRRTPDGAWQMPGSLRIRRVAELLQISELPDGDFETVAGLVLAELGHIPQVGEFIEVAGYRFAVAQVDGVRVTSITATPVEASS